MKWNKKRGSYFATCWNTIPSRGSPHSFPWHWAILLNQLYDHHVMKLTGDVCLRSCHTELWLTGDLLTWCPVATDCSMNPEPSSAGEEALSNYISLECQWRDGRIQNCWESHLCVLFLWACGCFPRVSVSVWSLGCAQPLKWGGRARIWSLCLPSEQIYDFFMFLKYEEWCIMVYI